VEKKGCEYLLRAMQLVQREQTDCELMIIGDGPLRSSLEVLARDLKLRCEFCGVQPAPIVRDMLQKSRVFCVPSVTAANGDSEGLGLVFAEAQSMGVPVVSTLHGGIPEIVTSGETGFLVPERAPQLLAEALSTLLADESMWQCFHEAALLRIGEHFDIHVQTQLLEKIYDRLLAAG